MGGWAYILRCADDSFYAGSTSKDDIEERVGEHNSRKFGGYTSNRWPVVLVWADWYQDLRDAQAAERRIKGWSRAKKIAFIGNDWNLLQYLAKPPNARRPSRLASRAPQCDALSVIRHPEVRASGAERRTRASKDDDAGSGT